MGMKVTLQDNMSVPGGVYEAVVESYTAKDGKYGKFLSISFRVQLEEGESSLVFGMCPATWRPESKLDKWIRACGLSVDTTIGATFDLDDLIGCRAQVLVEEAKNGDKVYANVTNVLPFKKQRTAAPQQPTATPATTAPAAAPEPSKAVPTAGTTKVDTAEIDDLLKDLEL